jgi:hypothetical protein
MEHIDYSDVTELFTKYRQKVSPSLSVTENNLVAEMATKLRDLDHISKEIVDLVSSLDTLRHPTEPVPDGDGYDIVQIRLGQFVSTMRLKRADPNVPIKRENSTVAYERGSPFGNPEIRDREGKLERATFGGGAVAAAGIWAVVTYLWPVHESPKAVCAQQGGIAAGRDASGNTLNYNGGAPVGGGAATCADPAKK